MLFRKLTGYSTLLLLFFACNNDSLSDTEIYNIPIIYIEKDTPIGWGEKEPCTLIYSAGKKEDILPATIKSRGGSSSKFEKHSFAVELENKYTFLDMPHDDDWILNASYIDKTFMRHKISYDLFRQMDKTNVASESRYVNVAVNGNENGLYLLMEEVNAAMAGLDKTDPQAMMFKDPPVFYEEKLPEVQDPANYYQQKYPKIYDNDKTMAIEAFKDFLFNSTDEAFKTNISGWVDIDNIADWHLLLLFSNNSDGIMKNFYLYKTGTEKPFRIAIWDYDHSFGRDGDNELNMMERELDCNRSVLLRRLTEIPGTGYSDKLKERWAELRDANIISFKNMREQVQKNDQIIREVAVKNFEIWPEDSHWYYDANNYDQEIDILLQFVNLRLEQLDRYFNYTFP